MRSGGLRDGHTVYWRGFTTTCWKVRILGDGELYSVRNFVICRTSLHHIPLGLWNLLREHISIHTVTWPNSLTRDVAVARQRQNKHALRHQTSEPLLFWSALRSLDWIVYSEKRKIFNNMLYVWYVYLTKAKRIHQRQTHPLVREGVT
jgi:hypothetical protein